MNVKLQKEENLQRWSWRSRHNGVFMDEALFHSDSDSLTCKDAFLSLTSFFLFLFIFFWS